MLEQPAAPDNTEKTKTSERLNPLQILLLIFNVALPLLAILVWSFPFLETRWPEGLVTLSMLALWVFFVPILAVYSGIAFLRFLPHRTRQLVPLFLPLAISIVTFFQLKHELTDLPDLLYAEAAPYVIGLALLMGIAVIIKITQNVRTPDGWRDDIVARLSTMAAILIPWFASIGVVAFIGWHAWQATLPNMRPLWSGLLFVGNCTIIVATFYPKFKQLDQEGRL